MTLELLFVAGGGADATATAPSATSTGAQALSIGTVQQALSALTIAGGSDGDYGTCTSFEISSHTNIELSMAATGFGVVSSFPLGRHRTSRMGSWCDMNWCGTIVPECISLRLQPTWRYSSSYGPAGSADLIRRIAFGGRFHVILIHRGTTDTYRVHFIGEPSLVGGTIAYTASLR